MPFGVKLLIRAVLSVGLAVLLSRFFFRQAFYPGVIGLSIFFLCMSYLAEYIRKRG
ncbi:MAG: hypothetical protein AB1585_08355 [Thermodesulfobacteriota bacterium]